MKRLIISLKSNTHGAELVVFFFRNYINYLRFDNISSSTRLDRALRTATTSRIAADGSYRVAYARRPGGATLVIAYRSQSCRYYTRRGTVLTAVIISVSREIYTPGDVTPTPTTTTTATRGDVARRRHVGGYEVTGVRAAGGGVVAGVGGSGRVRR